jgi:tape measure domain-containing protein
MAQESRLSIVIDSRSAQQQVDALRGSLNSLQNSGSQATVSVRGLGSAAKAAAGALAGIGVGRLASSLLEMTDRFKTMAGQINLVSTSTTEAARTFETLKAMANSTGSSLESTVTLFTRMSNATRGAGFSQEQLLKATDAVNKAFLVSSATQQEATSASIQLSQAMASGVLRGEELNSVMEQAPRITRALSEYLGVSNGQIRAMAAEGKITSEIVMNSLLRSLSSLNKEVATMPPLFERASQVLKNNFLAAIGQVDTQPAIDSVKSLGEAFASPEIISNIKTLSTSLSSIASIGVQGFQGLVSNIDALIAVTGAYAARVGTGLVISLAAAAKARYDSIVATQAQIVAERQATLSAADAAAQASRSAVVDQAAALATAQRTLAETAAARAFQANALAQIQAVQAQLVADRTLEQQRLRAQITDVGRQQSLARLAEIRLAEAAVTTQQTAAQSAHNQSMGAEVIAQSRVTAANVALVASREADTAAVAAQSAAQLRLNAAQTTGARASSALLGLAGGPIGLLTTAITVAAGAALYFATSSDSATQSLIDQNLTIDDSIDKYRKLTAEQQRYQSAAWMESERKALESATSALNDYFNRAQAGLSSVGASGVESVGEFQRMFDEVKSGQRSLDSLTGWISSNTQVSAVYRDELVKLAASYSSSSQKAADFQALLGKSKEPLDKAAAGARALADSQSASSAAVSGGAQAWDKYISQLTQTRDLIGANASQEAAYSAAKAGFNTQQIEYARLIGQQTDLLKKYEQAVKDGKAEEQSRLKVQLTASITASEAIKAQTESQAHSMKKMAEQAESSAKRQVDAIQTVIDQTVRYTKGLSLVETYQPKQNLQGSSLLTFGQPQAPKQEKAQTKTVAQMVQDVLDQIDGNTDTKTKKPKAESGLASKLSAAQTAFDGLYKAAQPAKFALQEYVEKQGQLALLLSKGKITQDEYNQALAQVSVNYAAAIKGAQGLTQAEQYRAQLEKQLSTQRTQYSLEAAGVGMGDQQSARLQQRVQLEQQTNDRILQLRTELANATTEKQRQDLQAQIDLTNEFLPRQLEALQAGWSQMDAAMLNPINGWTAAVQNFGTQAMDIAGQTQSIFSSAFNTISTDITAAIMNGSLSFSTLGDIGADVLRQIISGFVKMGVQMAINAALSATLGAATAGTSIALAGTTAAAWAAPAALASLATLGGNSIPAAAALTSTTALATTLAAIPGFSTGGFFSGAGTAKSDSNLAKLSDGEFIVNAAATRKNRALLEAINSGERVSTGGSSVNVGVNQMQAPVVQIFEDASKAGTSTVTREGNQDFIKVWVANVMSDGEAHNAMQAKYGLQGQGS